MFGALEMVVAAWTTAADVDAMIVVVVRVLVVVPVAIDVVAAIVDTGPAVAVVVVRVVGLPAIDVVAAVGNTGLVEAEAFVAVAKDALCKRKCRASPWPCVTVWFDKCGGAAVVCRGGLVISTRDTFASTCVTFVGDGACAALPDAANTIGVVVVSVLVDTGAVDVGSPVDSFPTATTLAFCVSAPAKTRSTAAAPSNTIALYRCRCTAAIG